MRYLVSAVDTMVAIALCLSWAEVGHCLAQPKPPYSYVVVYVLIGLFTLGWWTARREQP